MFKVHSCLKSIIVLGFALTGLLHAQPEGFYLIEGEASSPFVDATGCNVVKVGKHAIINWDSFSIGENETFRFEMEDSESSVINFVSKDLRSSICGNLQASGKVYIANPNEVFIGQDGSLAAHNIFLVAEQGKIEVNGKLIATAVSGKSGKIHVLGKEVEIQAAAVIDASGDFGEGEVLIGGSYQGMDRSIPHSERTVVHSGARISVDSFEFGNGGRAIIWSDKNTYFYGHVNAEGGRDGGDGGFVEVSGKDQLAFHGTVLGTAPKGNPGELLLDPGNVILVSGSSPTLPADNIGFNSPQPDATLTIGIDSVMTALGTASVNINANIDISITGSNSIVPSGSNTLTLRAGNSILIGESVTINLGPVTLQAFVNSRDATLGLIRPSACVFQMLAGSSIKTTSGDILIGAPKSLLRVPAAGSLIMCAPGQCLCASLNNCPNATCCPDSITTVSGFKTLISVPPTVQLKAGLLGGAGVNLLQPGGPTVQQTTQQ